MTRKKLAALTAAIKAKQAPFQSIVVLPPARKAQVVEGKKVIYTHLFEHVLRSMECWEIIDSIHIPTVRYCVNYNIFRLVSYKPPCFYRGFFFCVCLTRYLG